MSPLQPPPVLVLDDEPIITMTVADLVADAGAAPVVFSDCASALSWLADATPALAIVDRRLKGEDCDKVVEKLTQLNVPWLVFSGLPKQDAVADANAIYVSKPDFQKLEYELLTHLRSRKAVA